MAFLRVRFLACMFIFLSLPCWALCQNPNHIIVELNYAGLRQQVVKPTNTITFYQDGNFKGPVPVTFTENSGAGPCTASPNVGTCTIASGTQRSKAYTYGYCSDYKPVAQGRCATGKYHTALVRVRKDAQSEKDPFETGTVVLALSPDGEINHFVDPDQPDVMHWRDPVLGTPRSIVFTDTDSGESPCINPGLVHSRCTVQPQDSSSIVDFSYLVCSDDASNCDDPTLHVLPSNKTSLMHHRHHGTKDRPAPRKREVVPG